MEPWVLSVIILSILAAAFVLVIVNEVRKKKRGGGFCSNCSGCPMSGECHKKK